MDDKNKRICFRATEKEYQNLMEVAKTANISLSDYIRSCVNHVPVVVSNHNELIAETKKLTAQIYPIGNNLNQISKQLNSTGEIKTDLKESIKGVKEVMEQAKICYQKIGQELEKQTIKFNKKKAKGGGLSGLDKQ